jgi:hypothetical protein
MNKLRISRQTDRKTACQQIMDKTVELMHVAWCELNGPQIIEVVTRMNALLSEEERHKQELLFNPHPKC